MKINDSLKEMRNIFPAAVGPGNLHGVSSESWGHDVHNWSFASMTSDFRCVVVHPEAGKIKPFIS